MTAWTPGSRRGQPTRPVGARRRDEHAASLDRGAARRGEHVAPGPGGIARLRFTNAHAFRRRAQNAARDQRRIGGVDCVEHADREDLGVGKRLADDARDSGAVARGIAEVAVLAERAVRRAR